MNSKIGGVLSVNKMLVSENRHQGKAGGSPTGSARSKEAGAAEDSVVLTDVAKKLVDAEMDVSSGPVIDRARIEEIKSAIAQGSFKPDAEKIASKLIELEMSFQD